jgi:hypothetical protein
MIHTDLSKLLLHDNLPSASLSIYEVDPGIPAYYLCESGVVGMIPSSLNRFPVPLLEIEPSDLNDRVERVLIARIKHQILYGNSANPLIDLTIKMRMLDLSINSLVASSLTITAFNLNDYHNCYRLSNLEDGIIVAVPNPEYLGRIIDQSYIINGNAPNTKGIIILGNIATVRVDLALDPVQKSCLQQEFEHWLTVNNVMES